MSPTLKFSGGLPCVLPTKIDMVKLSINGKK